MLARRVVVAMSHRLAGGRQRISLCAHLRIKSGKTVAHCQPLYPVLPLPPLQLDTKRVTPKDLAEHASKSLWKRSQRRSACRQKGARWARQNVPIFLVNG
jgi:hypothetical protein